MGKAKNERAGGQTGTSELELQWVRTEPLCAAEASALRTSLWIGFEGPAGRRSLGLAALQAVPERLQFGAHLV